jgi:hypothetical protein
MPKSVSGNIRRRLQIAVAVPAALEMARHVH